jgi:hypothetical protein
LSVKGIGLPLIHHQGIIIAVALPTPCRDGQALLLAVYCLAGPTEMVEQITLKTLPEQPGRRMDFLKEKNIFNID